MRIAHFYYGRCNPDTANGVEKTISFLSRAQAQIGQEVSIFSVTSKVPLPIAGVHVRTYRPGWSRFTVPRLLVRELRTWNPAVVHLHGAYVPANVSLAQTLSRLHIPYVITPNGILASSLLRRRPHLKLPYKYLFELPCLNQATFIHAVGDEGEIRTYGATAPIVTAPNGFDLDCVPRDLSRDLIRQRWPEAAGRRIILFLGRLDVEQKGLDLLVRAFSDAGRRQPLALVLAGPDWKGGRLWLERLASQLGLGDQVRFWGRSSGKEKFELLASADLFAYPSRWEGLPFSVLEALATGTPCLVTSAADPIGIVRRSGAGAVVAMNSRAIADGIVALTSQSRCDLRRLGTLAIPLIARELQWTTIAQVLQSQYERRCVPAVAVAL